MTNKTVSNLNDLTVAFNELRHINPMLELVERNIDGIDYNVFKNAPPTLRDLINTVQLLMGDFPFINDKGTQYQFSEIISKAKSVSNYLARQDLKPGDSVGISMQNSIDWVISFLGIAGSGMTCVPFNSWWTKDELAYGVEHSEVKLIFVDQKRYDLSKDLNVNLVISGSVDGAVCMDEVLKAPADEWPILNANDEDVAVVLYTSGSTGLPKGVMLTHLSIINALLGFYALGELTTHITKEPLLQVENASVIINVPLFHVTGLITQFLLSMLAKRNMYLMHKWDPTEALKLIHNEKITNVSGVPTQSWDLLNHPEVDSYDLSSLIDIGAGGSARPEGQVKQLSEKFNLPLTFAWGMTETAALGTIHRGESYLERPNSCGLPVPLITEIGIMDENWNLLKTNEIGELAFKSPTNTIGYLKSPDETAKTIQNGWLRTGDLGYIDEDGFLFIVDRKKALIIRGGENISTLEVENAIDKHPSVLESCVSGVEDEKFGEIVGALIYCKHNLSPDEIKNFLSKNLAGYKIPELIVFTSNPLPRIASEKIDRVLIKGMLLEQK
ncbi:MAG: class I adenylate-forming enzyme family protein [Proteobacteria bacterium]|nr:class I adenylate-forming enzyme family protein [Pseudomonadota bacterium]